MKILLAEDDLNIRLGLEKALIREGYSLITAENGRVALEKYYAEQPDFLILDIMMPMLDGYEVCREVRKNNEYIPIVFLSAKDEEIDRVVGLELGADDYISKPFGIHEVRARIKAIARRCSRVKGEVGDECFLFGNLTIYPSQFLACRGEERIELSLREVKILHCFYINKNQVVTRDMLFNYAWGYEHVPNSRTLDQHISKLRRLIEYDSNTPHLIKTVHGLGYKYQE